MYFMRRSGGFGVIRITTYPSLRTGEDTTQQRDVKKHTYAESSRRGDSNQRHPPTMHGRGPTRLQSITDTEPYVD